jgi:hypothetical protein
MRRLERAVYWRRLDRPGGEHCALWATDEGWELRGTAVAVLEGRPIAARYVVVCDAGWRTRRVGVTVESGGERRGLRLTVDDEHRWWQGGREVIGVRGCVDVDLGISPSTNTLPIRRLAPATGDVAELRAAWIRFPDLSVEALDQRYILLGSRVYRYESRHADRTVYAAELIVDDLDLVDRYADVWVREATSDGT